VSARHRTAVLLFALLLPGAEAGAQVSTTNEAAAWREDLAFLAAELPRRHKNAFARLTREQWDAAVRRLEARLPGLQRHEIIVELMRLVAMVRDGHTFLTPYFEDRIGFHRLPVQLYDFADGLFIVAADSAHADLAGARVRRIGRADAAAALDSAAQLVSHESPQWARLRGPALLAIPEVLAGLGLTTAADRATVEVEQNGRERTVELEASGPAAAGVGETPAGWVDMRHATPGDDPLWLQRPDAPYWFTILPDRTLYVCYRAVEFIANGETNEAFFHRAFAAGDSAAVERVILDIRTNGGGNNFLNRFLVREVIRRPTLDQPDRFFVLIGRGVFSAAQNLVNELDFYTAATFIGEPTGNAPNQYGDPRRLELPRSRLRVLVSSLYWPGHVASDERSAFTPDVYVEATSADYRLKGDPVLATALRRATEPGLGRRLHADAERGDTAAVRRAVEAYRAHSENRYRDVEADVNAAGYELLHAGNVDAAIAVFQVNLALFPQSPNVFDSLGEALERAGRREAAIAAYRRALELNPGWFSAREGLRRLVSAPTPRDSPLVIRNVTVIPATGVAPIPRATVVVADGRIRDVTTGTAQMPPGAQLVNGTGKYLIPGLFEMHGHVSKTRGSSLGLFVVNGVTTVRDMGGDHQEVLGWRREVRSGDRVGPRLLIAGPYLESANNVRRQRSTPPEEMAEPVERTRVPVGSPEDAKRVVDSLAQLELDYLKIRTVQNRETYRAIVAAARVHGLEVVGHAGGPPEAVLEAGQRSLEHGFLGITLDSLTRDQRMILWRRLADADIGVVPTLVTVTESVRPSRQQLQAIVDDSLGRLEPRRRYLSRFLIVDWQEQVLEHTPERQAFFERTWPSSVRNLREMREAGVRIMAGSDAAVLNVFPGSSLHEELALFVNELGFTPLEAIEAATRKSAEFLGLADSVGTIEPGKVADLVLLDADPLSDIRNTRRIAAVVLRGRLSDRRGIDEVLASVEAAEDRRVNDWPRRPQEGRD